MSQTRREFISQTAALLLAGSVASSCRASPRPASRAGGEPTEPTLIPSPGEETPEIRSLIDKAQAQLASNGTNADLLSDPAFMPAHQWPRFRALIRQHAQGSHTVIVTPQEPGEPLLVSGLVRSKENVPLAGALVYFYQTNARGLYSDTAPHVSGNSGDQRHPRLFGYVTTSREGTFEFRTVRPAGYPRSTLPQHIHLEISGPDSRRLVTEIQFEDDPRLTAEMRAQSVQSGFQICRVTRDASGAQRVNAEFRLRS